MNIEILHKYSKEYTEDGLYRGSFKSMSVVIYRQIDYANNVVLVESEEDIEDEALAIYSIYEEASRCLYWSKEFVSEFISTINPADVPVKDFLVLYETHFRGSDIFKRIDAGQVDVVYSFSRPAYDDWCGELFVRAGRKKYILMWDYSD